MVIIFAPQMISWLLSITTLLLAIYSHFYYGQDSKLCDGNYISPTYKTIPINTTNKRVLKIVGEQRYELKRHYEYRNEDVGVPVLFLVGNAGSFGQARSFGAVAYRLRRKHTVNLFTIDTLGELSAFNAKAVEDQALFANECVKTILDSFDKKPRLSCL